MAAPRVRLAAPRRRPAAAGGRSLPPSCCGKTPALGEEGGLLRRLGWGREPGHRRASWSSARGEGAPQAPGEEVAGERVGRGQPDRSRTTVTPTATPDLPPLTTNTPRRRGRGSRYTRVPAGSRGAAGSGQKGAPSTLEPSLEGGFCQGIPPQPSVRLSRRVRCPLLPENGNVHHLQPPFPRFPLLSSLPSSLSLPICFFFSCLLGCFPFPFLPLASWNFPSLVPSPARKVGCSSCLASGSSPQATPRVPAKAAQRMVGSRG